MTTNLRRTTALALVAFTMIIATGRPKAQAADFAFRFEYGCGLYQDRFDTFSSSFTRNLNGVDPSATATIRLSLSSEQMRAISEAVEGLRFFDYPAKFSGGRAGVDEVITVTPAYMYRLEVRSAGRLHTVTWNDGTLPSSLEADRLHKLFELITGFITEHPDVKGLPSRFACE
jgi:hypothetical protein